MKHVLVAPHFVAKFGPELREQAQRGREAVTLLEVPHEDGARLSQADCDRIDCTFIDHGIRLNDQLYAAYTHAVTASKSLRWIHLWASGVGHIPFVPELAAKGVIVTSSTGANAEPVAQTGFTGLLMLARGFPQYIQGQQRRQWKPLRAEAMPDDLRGQTLLLIGVGAIGRLFAGYARAFDLRVIGVRRSVERDDGVADEMHPPAALANLLPRADWIVLACPLTTETYHLLNDAAFERMRPGVRLINIARGHVIDEAAMIQALRSGKLAGAALDAHAREPLPADSPLWDMPNVIITPKNAAASTGNERRYADMFIANFGHWIRGEPMFNVQSSSLMSDSQIAKRGA